MSERKNTAVQNSNHYLNRCNGLEKRYNDFNFENLNHCFDLNRCNGLLNRCNDLAVLAHF